MSIPFRPHHFLCALCFQGKGYSPTFIAHFQALMDRLNAPGGDEESITITADTDHICEPCPHRRGKRCTSQAKIRRLDEAHAAALAIEPGSTLTWREAKTRIREKLTLKQFHTICQDCEWKAHGICESVLQKYLKGNEAC